jgi:D-threo-aldose 1-dehydrogenase
LLISTKAGTFQDAAGKRIKSFEPDRIRDSVVGSLVRLGIEQIDILYLHGPEIRDLSPALIDGLNQLKIDGLIRYSGINTFERPVLDRIGPLPFDVVMTQYNLFDIARRDLIESLQRTGKTIIAGTALGQGIFDFQTLIPRNRKSLWYLLRALKNDPLFPVTRWRARQRIFALGGTPLEAAMQFLLQTPSITSSVFGTTTAAHLEQNIAAARAAQARSAQGSAIR